MSEAEQTALGDNKEIEKIVQLRMAVGFLGEQDQGNWWASLWFSPNAVAFLSPIYGERIDAARYHGLVQAARRVHDSRIGVGRAFHLFRLPETLERQLHDAVTGNDAMSKVAAISSKQDAEAVLSSIAISVDAQAGPIRVGNAKELEGDSWPKKLAGHYLSAFKSSQQTFPYFAEGL